MKTDPKKPKTDASAKRPLPQADKGWKDTDYNEGGGIKDQGGRAPQPKSK